MAFLCSGSKFQRTLWRQDQNRSSPRCGELRVLRKWCTVLYIKHRLDGHCSVSVGFNRFGQISLTLSSLLAQQRRARSGLFSVPHDGTLIWGEPDPALVSRAMSRYIHDAVLSRDW